MDINYIQACKLKKLSNLLDVVTIVNYVESGYASQGR